MIPLEDNAGDIIGKAQRGLGISDSELAQKAGVNPQTIRKLRDGDFDQDALLSIAPVLGLDGRALGELAKDEWRPDKIESLDGVAQFTTDYNGMAVNAFLVWDPATRAAAAFDTGVCFYAIRLEPYLVATGRVHTDLAPRLEALASAIWRGHDKPFPVAVCPLRTAGKSSMLEQL